MNSLKVPEGGLLLEGSAGKDSQLPPQAFAITLNDNVIEDMIKCVQGGGDIQLALGNNPAFLFDSKTHIIPPPAESYPYDLYLTKPFESTRRAEKLPHAMSIFKKPKMPAKIRIEKAGQKTGAVSKSTVPRRSSPSSEVDAGLENLRGGLQAAEAAKEKARMINLPTTKTGKGKGKLLPGAYSSAPRSMPASPAAMSGASPATPILNASQQSLERAKEMRVTFIHELAVKDRTLEYLKDKWTGKEEDMRPTLNKVADEDTATKRYSLKRTYWKELDVFNYDYTDEDRQKAIDNAVRMFDRLRVGISDPSWQKLLPKEDRDKGICLSRVQVNLAKGPQQATPRHAASDGGSTPKDDAGSVNSDKSKVGSQSMSRSGSNPLPSKPKKTSGQDAQVKRLLGNGKAKAKTAATAAPKTSPVKPKALGTKANGGRILSKEIIENSDSSGDEVVVKPKATAKPLVKPIKASPRPKETVVASRPVVKEPVRERAKVTEKLPGTQKSTIKRPRDDDDSSSSSGSAPLAKRLKPKQLPSAPPVKHRPSDASQNSRGGGTASSSLKSKNTSPTKSSPLASSPPTNASDLEHDAPPAPAPAPAPMKKRKADVEAESQPPASKRHASGDRSPSPALVSKAAKFQAYYSKYTALHYELAALENPPKTKVTDLVDMRSRLVTMKKEIYRESSREGLLLSED